MSDIVAKSKASSFRVSQIAMIGVVTAVTCVLGPLALPIGPVPISLTNLVIYFSLYMDQRVRCFLALVVGTAICYGFGTAWLAYQAHMTFAAALAAGVIPFIIGDLIKIVLAVVIGPQIRKRLAKAGVYA